MMAPAYTRAGAALIALLASSLGVHAVTVGLSPAEDPLYSKKGLATPMPFVVSGCLDRLFDTGIVASDSSIAPATRAEWESAPVDESTLKDAFVDFDIKLYVEWKESSFKKEVLLPARIAFRLVRVADEKVLAEGSVDGPQDSEDAAMHHETEAAKAGAVGIASCIELLRTLAKGDQL